MNDGIQVLIQGAFRAVFNNRLKKMIREGQPAVGCWVNLADPSGVEIIANAGFDWLLVDTEHCPIGPESLRDILVACQGSESVPMIRLMGNEPEYFKMALDLGAYGVIVPMIESSQDAKRAVEYCRYPPAGIRGFSPMRASKYFRNVDEYIKEANQEILLVAQIETIKSVQQVETIAGTEGIDAIFIGPSDLSSSMNLIGQLKHPRVQEAVDHVITKVSALGKPYGIPTTTPDEFTYFVERGATLLTVGGDIPFLRDGADRCLKERQELLASKSKKAPRVEG